MRVPFENAKLLDTPKIREAFELVISRIENNLAPQILKNYKRQFDEAEYTIKNSEDLSDAEKKENLDKVEANRKAVFAPNSPHFERAMQASIQNTLNQMGYVQGFGISQSLSKLGKDNAEDMVIANLLYNSVLTPMDYKDAEKKFGTEVVNLLSEVKQARLYRESCDTETLSDKAQTILLMEDIFNYQSFAYTLDSLQPGEMMKLYPIEYVDQIKERQSLLGKNTAVDNMYEDAFNTLQEKLGTGISIYITNGEVKLTTPDKVDGFILAGPDPDGSGPKSGPKGPGNGPAKGNGLNSDPQSPKPPAGNRRLFG